MKLGAQVMADIKIERFYTLDVLRGVAALSVVVWHFQHFYYEPGGQLPENFRRSAQPLYQYLSLFYEYGYFAVQLFWILSGFIFFWMYLEKINNKTVDGKEFLILRVSRLYPLHFITLIFVAFLQIIFIELNGHSIVYHANTLKNFVLNLFFISDWRLRSAHSFNGPIWSVSVEIFAYIVFYFFSRFGFKSLTHCVVVTAASFILYKVHPRLGDALFCFFMGGIIYIIYNSITQRFSLIHRAKIFVPVLIAVAFAACFFVTRSDGVTSFLSLRVVFFPSIVLLLAFLQARYLTLGKSISIVGDITYSSYLIHFPLQLVIIGFSEYLALLLNPSVFFFFVYLVVLVIISYLVYENFERPAQRFLRRSLSRFTRP